MIIFLDHIFPVELGIQPPRLKPQGSDANSEANKPAPSDPNEVPPSLNPKKDNGQPDNIPKPFAPEANRHPVEPHNNVMPPTSEDSGSPPNQSLKVSKNSPSSDTRPGIRSTARQE